MEQESGFHDAHLSADYSHDSILDGDLNQHQYDDENKRPSSDGLNKKPRSMVRRRADGGKQNELSDVTSHKGAQKGLKTHNFDVNRTLKA